MDLHVISNNSLSSCLLVCELSSRKIIRYATFKISVCLFNIVSSLFGILLLEIFFNMRVAASLSVIDLYSTES